MFSFFIEYNLFSYSIFGLRKVSLALQVSWRRGARESLDQHSFNQVWTFLISKYCLYIIEKLYAYTFQPWYVDGLLNPTHRILSFTIELATPLGRALSVWGFFVFLSSFYIVSGPSCHLGTLYKSDRTPPLPP